LNYPMESCSDDESDRYGFNEQRGHGLNEGGWFQLQYL